MSGPARGDVPADLRGLRTFFNAFHHFGPRDALAILEAAVASRERSDA